MKTVVLLSGGLDSAVVLASMLSNQHPCEALTIDYGQRHRREIQSARALAEHYGVGHTVVSLDPALFTGSALTGAVDVPKGVALQPDETYVPARNTVFIALAAARAEATGAQAVAFGANKDDAAAYPDCRRKYVEALRDVLNEGTATSLWLMAPLLADTKADILAKAKRLHVPTHLTWSCYVGGDEPCGQCGACIGRGAA